MYVDLSENVGALKVIVASEVAPGAITVCKYLK